MGSIFSSPKTEGEAAASAVGSAIGSLLPIPVPFVGSFIGSTIGKAIGGLFGSDKDYPYGRADVYFRSGKAEAGPVTVLDGADSSDFNTLGSVTAQSINEIVSLTGSKDITFKDTGKNYTTQKLGYADARGQLSTGFFAGGGGDFKRGATYEGLTSAESAIDYSIRDFLGKATFNDKPELTKTISDALTAGKNSQEIYDILAPKETNTATSKSVSSNDFTTTQPDIDPYQNLRVSQANIGLLGAVFLFILITMKGK